MTIPIPAESSSRTTLSRTQHQKITMAGRRSARLEKGKKPVYFDDVDESIVDLLRADDPQAAQHASVRLGMGSRTKRAIVEVIDLDDDADAVATEAADTVPARKRRLIRRRDAGEGSSRDQVGSMPSTSVQWLTRP